MNSLLHACKTTDLLGVKKGWPWQYKSPTRLFVKPASGIKALSRFTEDGTIAVAERSADDAKLVYVAAYGGLSPEYFHHLAQDSGAYVPTDGYGLEIDMNGDFMSLHCLKAGSYEVRLPFTADVLNLKTGRRTATAARSVKMDLEACETRWYQLIPAKM